MTIRRPNSCWLNFMGGQYHDGGKVTDFDTSANQVYKFDVKLGPSC